MLGTPLIRHGATSASPLDLVRTSFFSQPSSFALERSDSLLIPIRGFDRPIYLLLFRTTLTTGAAMWIVHEIAFFASVAYYIIISRIPSLRIYKVQKVRPFYTSLFTRKSSETRSLTMHDGTDGS